MQFRFDLFSKNSPKNNNIFTIIDGDELLEAFCDFEIEVPFLSWFYHHSNVETKFDGEYPINLV